MNINNDVISIITSIIGNKTQLSEETKLDDLMLNSIQTLMIISEIEEKYSVEIDLNEIISLDSVSDIVGLIGKKINEKA